MPSKSPAQQCFAVFLALLMIGGPLGFFQVVAWSGMMISYSAESGLAQGMKDTFSGEKPCPLCCAIKKAKEEARKNPLEAPVQPAPRLDLFAQSDPYEPVLRESFRDGLTPAHKLFFPFTGDAPPIPPPRC